MNEWEWRPWIWKAGLKWDRSTLFSNWRLSLNETWRFEPLLRFRQFLLFFGNLIRPLTQPSGFEVQAPIALSLSLSLSQLQLLFLVNSISIFEEEEQNKKKIQCFIIIKKVTIKFKARKRERSFNVMGMGYYNNRE